MTFSLFPLASVSEELKPNQAVVIQKAPLSSLTHPDYEIVTGIEEISGDPALGLKESFASWKRECAAWKKEKRELNSGQVITLHCGSPTRETLPDNHMIQKSNGTFKVRVKIRDSKSR